MPQILVTDINRRYIEHHYAPKEHVNDYIVHLLWAELVFDVRYAIVKSAKLSGIKGEDAKNFQFTKDDKDWLLRQFDTAVHNVKTAAGWACVRASRFSTDELLDIPKEFNIVFRFADDDGWQGDADSLMNSTHNYVVNYTLAEWARLRADYSSVESRVLLAYDNLRDLKSEINNCIIVKPIFRL